MNTGRLKLEIVEAKLIRDTDTWSKMDPYVVIKLREQVFKTKTKNEAGKTPKWNEVGKCD